MQTLVAFAFHAPVHTSRVPAGLSRVDAWYGRLWGAGARQELAEDQRHGIALWHDEAEECRWPAWSARPAGAVATLYAPLGHERLVGTGPLAQAPWALVERLRECPAEVQRLTPPFVLAGLDADRHTLTLTTDGLGLGRLHEVRTPEGRFWSNRPVAALRFAGLRADADDQAWRRMAACDWAMGAATPYRGVQTVAAGSRIVVGPDGYRAEQRDVLTDLVANRRDPLAAGSLAETAAALTSTAAEVGRLWPGTPVLSLSGGRDSRLVVAAFLAAEVPVSLVTYGAAAGEAETARDLVARLPVPVEHQVTSPAAATPGRRRHGAYARARQWHDVTEGLRPAVYLRSNAPRRLLRHQPPLICGVGGEFGHAPGYPDDVEQLERLPAERRLDAFARSLAAKVVLPRGVAAHAVAATEQQIPGVLDHAAQRGVTGAKALDWFYADERLRRWGLAGESPGRVMPLLVPEFLSAAFGLSTTQSRASALHTALIDTLVPSWSGVPYYSATLQQRQAVRQQRLWEESDAELVGDLMAEPQRWGEAFDVPRVQAVWRAARKGRAAARDELLLQRVVWRAAFGDHLAAVNEEPAPPPPVRLQRPAEPTTAPPGPPGDPGRPRVPAAAAGARFGPGSLLQTLATYANDVPAARRLARTRLGRQLRRLLGV